MEQALFARSDEIPSRHEPSATVPYFSDFDPPLLDDRLLQKTPAIRFKHLSDQSVDFDRGHPSKSVRGRPCWTPFPLRRHVLLGFISVFASLLVALAVLFSYSRSYQGLSTANERLYYLWTYGPTAGMTHKSFEVTTLT